MQKTKLFILWTLLLSIFASALFAQERSYDEINNVALNFAKEYNADVTYTVKQNALYANKLNADDKSYKIINLEPKGWVLVSKNDIHKPVLGYSFEGNIDDTASISSEFKYILEQIDKSLKAQKETNGTKYKKRWDSLSVNPESYNETKILLKRTKTSSTSKVGPLLTGINWHQHAPYNNLTPITETGRHAPVGCGATAIAQIMAYHKWPQRGVGSHSYTSRYGELYVSPTSAWHYSIILSYLFIHLYVLNMECYPSK